jgi:hypothetical protein
MPRTVTNIPPFLSPTSSATSAVFSPRFARSTASSVLRAEQVAAELAQREREAILRLQADAVVAAELKKELNGWIAKAVEDDIENDIEEAEEKDKKKEVVISEKKNPSKKQSDTEVRFFDESIETKTKKEEQPEIQSSFNHKTTMHIKIEEEQDDVETLRMTLQHLQSRLESAEAAQFKAEMGERVALRKAAAHASAAAALRKVVAAIETSNARQTKKLLTRLATAGEQLTSNRIEIQTLKDELTLLKQQREREGKDLPVSLPKQTSLYASYQAAD